MPLPRPAPGTARWWVIGGVAVSVMVAVIVWLGLQRVGSLTPEVVGYRVDSDAVTWIDYQVNRPEGTAVTCTLTALDETFGRAGTATDEVPAGEGWVRRQVAIRTTHRAVTAVVDSCARTP
ncbi:MAG: DUF4307 domain-containing protein [Phycicoccus sp.]|nr:DUF4307 domain-containing protein [Phycicoccus sp.]